ncbi:ankyrin repeat domain-containing protein [bacterium]|nr:ankyrin repeat domain-containing protein [bacterium]MCI0604028.1 ankyrin repeat domain-containing protein [bacterium]
MRTDGTTHSIPGHSFCSTAIDMVRHYGGILLLILLQFIAPVFASEEAAKQMLQRLGIKRDETTFFERINRDDSKIVKLLIQSGIPANRQNELGITPLMVAAEKGSHKTVKVLLDAGVDVNAKDKVFTKTALMRAAENGHTEILKVLVKAGADLNARTETKIHFGITYPGNNTALLLATINRHSQAIEFLLDQGSDPTIRNSDGSTALSIAEKGTDLRLISLLKAAEERINQSKSKNTP